MSPPFQPYPLTALDHTIPSIYLAASLTFDLTGRDKKQVIRRLEDATERLLLHLPFLGGFVVPVPGQRQDGKVNTFEVRHCPDIEDPFFLFEEHPGTSNPLADGNLNPSFLRKPPFFQPQDPCPVLRFRANTRGNELFVVFQFHHVAMDGVGGSVMLKTLAQLCRNPDTPRAHLPTTWEAQQSMREHLASLAARSPPGPLPWVPKPPQVSQLDPSDPRNLTINRRFRIRAEKLKVIRDACLALIHNAQHGSTDQLKNVRLSPSLILGVLFGICSNRARHAAGQGGWYSPNVTIANNIRQQLGLPMSYIGNAVTTVECPLNAKVLPPQSVDNLHLPAGVPGAAIQELCDVVLFAQRQLKKYDEPCMKGVMGTLGALRDLSLIGVASDGFSFSDTHKMPFYQDYGPLGEVQDFAIPGNEYAGECWMLATKPSVSRGAGPQYYELQVALERAAMEELDKDPLFQWATDSQGPKSKL